MLFVSSPDVKGLREALKAAGPAWERDIVKAHREVGKLGANLARAAARSGSKQEQAAAPAIGQSASKSGAKVTVGSPSGAPFGRAVFWGASRRTGWYSNSRYEGSKRRQFPAWVGVSWSAGVHGEGPHVINDALADHIDEIRGVYGEQLEKVAAALAARRVTSF